MNPQVLWLWMQQLFGIGTRRAHEAAARFGHPERLLALSPDELYADGFLTPQEKRAVRSPDLEPAAREMDRVLAFGAAVLTPDFDGYPECLRHIHAPPMVLYAVGDCALLQDYYRITMVGTRHPDEYGLLAAGKLSREIAASGGVVVSGLAVGIDAACHEGALAAGGKTIALLAAGLDVDYPVKNRGLRRRIERDGLILTEYPLGDAALPGHFPVRNRLMSGVSLATVIVQSARHSGTMLTAAHALAQNRDLFAVPGSLFAANMEGCNALLADGAAPALSGQDILSRYQPIYGWPLCERPQEHREPPPPAGAAEVPDYLTAQQAAVLSRLLQGACTVEELAGELSMPTPALLAVVTQLEIFGLAEVFPGRKIGAAQRVYSNS